MKNIVSVIFLGLTVLSSSSALAWGERGHDLVTRVAVQNLRMIADNDKKIMQPFLARDHMLSHLANVPDIVWRAPYMSEQARQSNRPTHYIGVEKIYQNPKSIDDLDMNYRAFVKRANKKGIDDVSEIGTAPWRVLQLYKLMVTELANAKKSEASEQIDFTNKALVYAGLMSHFIGDLANPHHTTENHDGQLTGNTGLHAYFESDVVGELPLTLAELVFQRVDTALPLIVEGYSEARKGQITNDPTSLVMALMLNSNNSLGRLTELDNRFSLIEKSKSARERASRKAPEKVTDDYQSFVVERLAIGSAVLAQLWWLAWNEAGEPDLSSFKSYYYPVKPDFINPDY